MKTLTQWWLEENAEKMTKTLRKHLRRHLPGPGTFIDYDDCIQEFFLTLIEQDALRSYTSIDEEEGKIFIVKAPVASAINRSKS